MAGRGLSGGIVNLPGSTVTACVAGGAVTVGGATTAGLTSAFEGVSVSEVQQSTRAAAAGIPLKGLGKLIWII